MHEPASPDPSSGEQSQPAAGIFISRTVPAPGSIRLAVKDLFDTAGVRTTYGSAIFADHVPTRTAAAVALLEAAGYGSVGKANLHEFAWGITSENPHYGRVSNPLDPTRIAGGSSGGCAAALATGLADAALGSDSGGSIRIPSACCGTAGFKPTFGLVPAGGCFPLAPSFDHVGPMARDVKGCAELMTVLTPGLAVPELTLADLRVGVAWVGHADPLVARRVQEAADLFPNTKTLDLPLPGDLTAAFGREVVEAHAGLWPERAVEYGPDVAAKLRAAARRTDTEVDQAIRARDRYRDQFRTAAEPFDLILTPTMAMVAPPAGLGDLALRAAVIKLTYPFNATGWPALALPAGRAELGLPASVQLASGIGRDGLVLAAGLALERALAAPTRPDRGARTP